MRVRLLALDLDGTLLDPFGSLLDEVHAAVAEAQRCGLRVVLCTGRRFTTAAPVARELGLDGAIVVNNGVLVKDLASGATLHHAYLPPALYPDAVALLREAGSPLVYVDEHPEQIDIFTERRERAHAYQREYLDDHGERVRDVADLATCAPDKVVLTGLMADPDTVAAVAGRAAERLGGRLRAHTIQNKNYQGEILELLSPASGKWTALCRLAADERIGPQEIAAVGDDNNDADMLRGAGLGIAMGNAPPAVREAADEVVDSNAERGVVRAIERVLRSL